MGCRHGAQGILKYTQPQTISVQRILPLGLPPGGDAARARAGLLSGLLKLLRYLRV
jgi:succinate-semialdehyde dehydrogenase/glutarate-semialdehyde dehydrogenase